MERPSRLLRILDDEQDFDANDLYSPNTAPYATRPTRRSLAGLQLQQAGDDDPLLELMPSPDGRWIDMVPPASGGGAGSASEYRPSSLDRRALAGGGDDDDVDDTTATWRVQARDASVTGSEVRSRLGRGSPPARRLRHRRLHIQSHCAVPLRVSLQTPRLGASWSREAQGAQLPLLPQQDPGVRCECE